jgi:uncharacterized membrane protein YkoI
MIKLACFVAAVSLGATGALAAVPGHFAGAELLPQAKITLAQARSTALAARPGGQITDQELEKERGGTGLRYSFDIKSNGKTFEVGVDARTGKVLENNREGPNPD